MLGLTYNLVSLTTVFFFAFGPYQCTKILFGIINAIKVTLPTMVPIVPKTQAITNS